MKFPLYYRMVSNTAQGKQEINGKISKSTHETIAKTVGDDINTVQVSQEVITEIDRVILIRKLEAMHVILDNDRALWNYSKKLVIQFWKSIM